MPANSSFNPALDDARDSASDLRSRLDGSMDEIARRAEKAIHEGLEILRSRAGNYGELATERLDTAQRYVTTQVQERPLATSLTALGVGVVIGFLLSAGRRS
ncbi:MAG: DUF883 domain-containing protein [Caulobacteraceae bacterium]